LLLPQVAAEWGWSRDEFVQHACRKAGLPEDAWQRGATLYKFEAEVFGDKI
jgi:AMMECR1 domain-containing protein